MNVHWRHRHILCVSYLHVVPLRRKNSNWRDHHHQILIIVIKLICAVPLAGKPEERKMWLPLGGSQLWLQTRVSEPGSCSVCPLTGSSSMIFLLRFVVVFILPVKRSRFSPAKRKTTTIYSTPSLVLLRCSSIRPFWNLAVEKVCARQELKFSLI